jgi:hypothetical protein
MDRILLVAQCTASPDQGIALTARLANDRRRKVVMGGARVGNGWMLAALGWLVIAGCATRNLQPLPDRVVCVSEKVFVGARLPLRSQGWTEPEPYVITAIIGQDSRRCIDVRRPIAAWALPESVYKADRERARAASEAKP